MNGISSLPVLTLGTAVRGVCLITAALALMACHGSSSSSSYTIGGSITGLTTGSVELANGTATVVIAAGATSWTFSSSFAAKSSYSVTVVSEPAGELCEVGGGSGASLTGDIDDVTVECSQYGQWTWINGGSGDNAPGIYGTLGTASVSNLPGARYSASSWIDASGNMWLFGGVGYDAAGSSGDLNDLWRYNRTTGQWTWISGSNTDNAPGIYGTPLTPAATNVPGARYSASSWIDASGNLWLFGGVGYDAAGTAGNLNDLWSYSPSTGEWTWITGGNTSNAAGIYGTQGTAAVGNLPGARYAASSWIDATGNLWLFGGYGYDSTGSLGYLNDLWQFSPSTLQWTWISGGSGDDASGVYGTEGTVSASNVPGARQAASAWVDSTGDLWLFGGYGYDSTANVGALNDLWHYSPATNEWAAVTGGNVANASGVYGIQGTASAGNGPGARQAASSWIDSSGDLWLFGGAGYGSAGNGYLNDLWQFVRPE